MFFFMFLIHENMQITLSMLKSALCLIKATASFCPFNYKASKDLTKQ